MGLRDVLRDRHTYSRLRARARSTGLPPPLPEAPPHRKLFVAGCPRSGTTWVSRLLQAHPHAIGTRESQAYSQILRPLRRHARLGAAAWRYALRAYRKRVAAGRVSGIHNYVDRETFHRLVEDALRAPARTAQELQDQGERLIARIFDAFVADRGRGIDELLFVEKTPDHLLVAERILERFPDSRMIIVVRDGRDVCVSYQMLPEHHTWGPRDRRTQIETWTRYVERGLAVQSDPRWRQRILTVHYERLVEATETETARLWEFAGLPGTAAEVREAIDGTNRYKHVTQPLDETFRRGRTGSWRTWFDAADHALFREIAGETFARAGYAFEA